MKTRQRIQTIRLIKHLKRNPSLCRKLKITYEIKEIK